MRYEEEKLKNDFEKPKFTPYYNDPAERERGGCLTLFLVYILAFNGFVLFSLCTQYSELSRYSNPANSTSLFALGFGLECGVLACAAGIWNWKKWGYYGLLLSYVLCILLGFIGGNLPFAGGAVVGLIILVALVHDKLDMFD